MSTQPESRFDGPGHRGQAAREASHYGSSQALPSSRGRPEYSQQALQALHSLQSEPSIETHTPGVEAPPSLVEYGSHDLLQAANSHIQDPVEMATLIWRELQQALKKHALYLHQRQGREDFFYRPYSLLVRYFQSYGPMTVTLQPFDMLLAGRSVLRDSAQENSLTYKLYRSGIRSLTLETDLREEELVLFGLILAKTQVELQEEDIASRFWRADFQSINYLQIQTIEMANEDAEEGEELAELVEYIKGQMATEDPLNGVFFRGFAALDLQAEIATANSHTQRHFGILPGKSAMEHDDRVLQQLSQEQEYRLVEEGIYLYTHLLRHLESREALVEFEPHVLELFDALFEDQNWEVLAVFLDELSWQSRSHEMPFRRERELLLDRLLDKIAQPRYFEPLREMLLEAHLLSQEQRADLRICLQLLGTKIYKELLSLLPEIPQASQHFLLEVLCTSQHSAGLVQQLISSLRDHDSLLSDLLELAPQFGAAIPIETLREFLQHKSHQVQSRAFLSLVQSHPNEAPFLAEELLQKAGPDFRLFLLDALVRAGEIGVSLALSYVQSPAFQRFPLGEKVKVYQVLGESCAEPVLLYFSDQLDQKGGLLKPQVDRHKRQILAGLEASNHHKARQILIHALQKKGTHSKKILQALEATLERMQKRI